MDTKGILIWALFLAFCGAIWFISKKMKREIDKNGIETTGVISRFQDDGSLKEIDVTCYVTYTTEDGEKVEGLLSNPTPDLVVGQQVRIKYHPKHTLNARLV